MTKIKYQFEQLTPIDNVNLDVYEDAINYVFENSDIKNVAISGAYSAGKSSILASYKKKYDYLRFLHISLAHFKSSDKEDESKINESVLEGKILNQLIHQIPPDKIPQTNFRVKKRIDPKNTIKSTIEIVLFLIAIIYFIYFDIWNNYVNTLPENWLKSVLSLSTHQYALMIDGVLIIGLMSIIIYKFLNVQKNRNFFRKVNLQGNEIEIFEESDDSYFDKYLNEVLYLFENAGADVIVFEDMDRFNVCRIFERLREVNSLVNNQLKKENKQVIRFFYLLRDDIFTSKDRIKFFDYIIPIVPVLDSSNSYDQFISQFKNSGILEKISERFLQGLSLYIDDMRLLKNIYNEFVIYYNRLNTTELDCNKMLSIIAYKNLFPKDFADLQLSRGFVYTIFHNKSLFISKEINSLEEQIIEKNHEIEMVGKEHLKNIEELKIIYESKKDYRNRLSENDQLSFNERKKAIENCLNNKISSLKQEKSVLEQEQILIKNKQLCNIITKNNINSIFRITMENEIGQSTNFNEIKSSDYFDLLKYLIRNGYIDETYADYMTYFYGNSLSHIDKIFLRSITDKKAKEYTYKLKNPRLVVSRLKLIDFDQEEILNFDLLNYLFHTMSNIEYIEKFIDQLKYSKNFKFIGAFLDITTELPTCIKYFNMRWPELFLTSLNENTLTQRQIRKYSISSMYYSDDETIELINMNNCLCDYISNAVDYLAIDDPNIDRLIHCFKILGVSFKGFDDEGLDENLLYAVYEESLYEINANNIQLVQEEIMGITNKSDIFNKNYTLLYLSPDSAITQYISQNINEYFDVVFQISGETIFDDENVAIAALNNSNLSDEHKHSYISKLKTIIKSIKEINDRSLWSPLLDANIVMYSKQNIIDCFKAIKLNESVISYINRCNIDLDFSKIEDDNFKENLFDSVIECSNIENSKYEQILVSLEYYYDNFDIAEISHDKIYILIDRNIIRMTTTTLEFMRINYSTQNSYFIRKNIEEYVNIMNNTLFSNDELLEVLSWDISDAFKIKLLKFSNDEISIIGKNYSNEIYLYILNNNLMKSDLMDLFSSFEQWEDTVQTKIFDIAIKNITIIINNPNLVSKKLKNNLFNSNKFSMNGKVELLIAMMPDINEDYIKEILEILNLSEFLKIFDIHSRPKFEINDENNSLLTAFKEKDIICDYEENSDKEGYYKIIRKKH